MKKALLYSFSLLCLLVSSAGGYLYSSNYRPGLFPVSPQAALARQAEYEKYQKGRLRALEKEREEEGRAFDQNVLKDKDALNESAFGAQQLDENGKTQEKKSILRKFW